MDTRKDNLSKQNLEIQYVGDDIINKNDQILDYKQAANDYRYMDSLIFYLVRKTQITYQMNDLYKQERAKIQNSVLPPIIGNQVHSSYIIPIYVSSIIVLKLRKILTLQKAVGLLCLGTMYNEFIKFKNIRKLNEKLTQEYDEVSEGYSDLLSNLVSAMTYKDIFKQMFNLDVDKTTLINELQYDRLMAEEFTQNMF